MKKLYLLLFGLGVLFASCEKDQDAIISSLKIENEKLTPSYTSISVECQLNTQVAITSVFVQYSINKDFVDYQEVQMEKKDGKYIANVDELQDNTTYYIRYSVLNRYSSATTEEISQIKTLQSSIPSVKINSIDSIFDSHAKAEFKLEFDGGAPISLMGVCWSTSYNPTNQDNIIETKDTSSILKLTSLQPNTRYYLRGFAVNKVGIAYSDELTFITLDLPKVQTNEIVDIQLTSARLNGMLLFNGNDTTTIKGFCWSEKSEPTTNNEYVAVDTTDNTFSYLLSNLKDETQYYIRAYAKNKIGIVYGEQQSFTTQSAVVPTISTKTIEGVDYHTATVGGIVTNDGGAEVTERGICYSTTENPTIENTKVISGKGIGDFSINLDKLTDSTTYYVRAYAINKKGISYGRQISFTTKTHTPPTIETSLPTNISYTTVTVGGNVVDDGGLDISERGICYSLSQNPTVEDVKVTSTKGLGVFSIDLSNLSDSTTYYVRAYAINSKGISYGEDVSFTTKKYNLPTVATTSPTNISYTSATVGGTIVSNGGFEIIEQGICYSPSPNPTVSEGKIIAESSSNTFVVNLVGLPNGATYYVRAYAINNKGISYGNEVSFTTLAYFGEENGHQWVDLGLSVKWATMNIGASSNTATGDYFAWGEVEPKTIYNWSTYKWCNGLPTALTKYNTDSVNGFVDNKTVLELSDDAAAVNWGSDWRMPTKAEIEELITKCTWIHYSNYYRVTGPNGNSIYLVDYYYWSSSLTDYTSMSYYMYPHVIRTMERCVQACIRPVRP